MSAMKSIRLTVLLTFIIGHFIATSRAETIYLINGDQIQAKVVSLDKQSLSLHSDILGTLTIPRNKIARIDFIQLPGITANGRTPQTNQTPPTAKAAQQPLPSSIPGILNAGDQDQLIQQVQQQLLTTAGPEANEMYQQLVQGVMAGSVNVPQLKSMAQDTVNQIEGLQAELGEDVGFALDGYLGILKGFIQKAERQQTRGR
jgi:hypothetical protein